MKKVLTVLSLAVIFLLGSTGVLAAEVVEEVVEPSAFDNWVSIITDFASLKNFIVSIGGLATIASLVKLRNAIKFLKTPKGAAVIENYALKIIGKLTEKPELVIKIAKIVVTIPVIENIINKAERKANSYELELKGKILDIEAKLSAKVFEDGKQEEAIEYLTKLREEYDETIKIN